LERIVRFPLFIVLLLSLVRSVPLFAQGGTLLGGAPDTLIAEEAKLIDSDSADDRPSFTLDGKMMIFGSSRRSNHPWRIPTNVPGSFERWDSDLWYRLLQGDTVWSKPINIDTPVNNSGAQMNPTISPRGDMVYFVTLDGRGPIMQAHLVNGKFTDLKPVPGQINQTYSQRNMSAFIYRNNLQNSIFAEMSRDSNLIDLKKRSEQAWNLHYQERLTREVLPNPNRLDKFHFFQQFYRGEIAITPDNKSFLLADNFGKTKEYGLGGHGDDDIWIGHIRSDGSWDSLLSFDALNTEYSEHYPFIAADGVTLYFTSDRPCPTCPKNASGGEDLYVSRWTGSDWTRPQPLGAPFNSPFADYGFSIGPDGETAYFVSNRTGKSKLYQVKLRPQDSLIKPYPIVTVLGRVTDALTGKPVQAEIFIDNLNEEQNKTSVFSDSLTGNYILAVRRGSRFGLQAVANNYLPHSERVSFPSQGPFDLSKLDMQLAPIEIGSATEFKNVNFETGKATLLTESKLELDRIAKFLKNYPKTKIEIRGHTDDRGSDALNMKLSQARANTVRSYLIQQGIKSSRLTAVGYGKTKPLVKGTDDASRAKNRRVDMIIKEKEAKQE